MDGIYNDCPRDSFGAPKRPDQLFRWHRNQCVYCGKPKPTDLLGPACDNDECARKRWAELKLTEKQTLVWRRLYEGKKDKEIAGEMAISASRVKEHIRAIARKLGIEYSRVLLVRCYCEWQAFQQTRQTANTLPPNGNPSEDTSSKAARSK